MVVNLQNQNRQSINDSKAANALSTKETKEQISDLKQYRPVIQEGIKARADSFGKLQKAAAVAIWFFAKHGSPTLMNELYEGLGSSDREGFRSLFLFRVVDILGEQMGGKRGDDKKLDDGRVIQTWNVRPVLPFTFKSTATDGAYFAHAKAKKDDETHNGFIKSGKKAIVELGIDGLAEISWQKRDPKNAKPPMPINAAWAVTKAKKALLEIAKQGRRTEMSAAQLVMVCRAFGLDAEFIGIMTDAYATASEVNQAQEILQPETHTESETEKQEAPKQEQVAA